jgi:phage terminase small subunit
MAGPLKNQRHELFCQGVAAGKPASQAYRDAGYTATGNASEVEASKLVRNPKVAARIRELKAATLQRHAVTIDSLMADTQDIKDRALKGKRPQLMTALNATIAMAKLAGLWVEKRENTNRHVDPTRLSDAELAAIVSSGDAEEEEAQGQLH